MNKKIYGKYKDETDTLIYKNFKQIRRLYASGHNIKTKWWLPPYILYSPKIPIAALKININMKLNIFKIIDYLVATWKLE